ncbi:MAG: hypothetical protein Wins2KO_32390 [Winogradskyella sp.]
MSLKKYITSLKGGLAIMIFVLIVGGVLGLLEYVRMHSSNKIALIYMISMFLFSLACSYLKKKSKSKDIELLDLAIGAVLILSPLFALFEIIEIFYASDFYYYNF